MANENLKAMRWDLTSRDSTGILVRKLTHWTLNSYWVFISHPSSKSTHFGPTIDIDIDWSHTCSVSYTVCISNSCGSIELMSNDLKFIIRYNFKTESVFYKNRDQNLIIWYSFILYRWFIKRIYCFAMRWCVVKLSTIRMHCTAYYCYI